MTRVMWTVLLLVLSNVCMTFAWYWHVNKRWTVAAAIAVSWLIALPEYYLQEPANRIGYVTNGGPLSLPQLKIIQEGITIAVFLAFTVWVAKETPRVTDLVGFGIVFLGVAVAMWGRM